MKVWLTPRLRALLERLELAPSPSDTAQELRYLQAQLALLKQDQVSLDAMLKDKKDSFHHSIAAGTTTHVQELAERTARLQARIKVLEAQRQEEKES